MQQFDIVIVGAGTAGLTAAIYALRAGKTVLVTEGESFGGQITSSPRVENYPGISQISGSEFADNLVSQAMELGADVELERVIKIVDGKIKTVITDSNSYQCKCVIIATGARHRPLGADGENDLAGRGVSYCAVCDGAFYKGKNVAVVGGGDSALQSALFLASYCKSVTLIHRRNEFRGEKALVKKLGEKDNIKVLMNTKVVKLIGSDELDGIKIATGDEEPIPFRWTVFLLRSVRCRTMRASRMLQTSMTMVISSRTRAAEQRHPAFSPRATAAQRKCAS